MSNEETKETLEKSEEIQNPPVNEDADKSSEEEQVVKQDDSVPVEENASENKPEEEKPEVEEESEDEDSELEKSEVSEIETLKKALSELTEEIAELKKDLSSKEINKSGAGGRLSLVKSTSVSEGEKFLKFLKGFKVKK